MAGRMEQLAALLLNAFEFGSRAHWATRSYAKHMALGDFYEALPGFVDELVETYQGEDQALLKIPQLPLDMGADPEDFIRANLELIRAERANFDALPEFQNLIDTIVSHYQRTLYKLRFLG